MLTREKGSDQRLFSVLPLPHFFPHLAEAELGIPPTSNLAAVRGTKSVSSVLAARLRTLVIISAIAIALPVVQVHADDASVYQQKATAAYGLGE